MSEHKLEIKIVADNRQAIAAIGDQARAMGMLAQKVEVAQADFRKLAAAVAVGHGAFAGLAATLRAMTVSLPRAVIATAAEFESLEAAMRAVFGSAEAVRREMDALRAMSDRLGLPLETLSRQWLSFAAAARGTAMEGEAAREAFTSIAEAATVLGMSSAQLEGALLAVQQMISKGTVSSEELRQQLGERLYGAVQVAARSIGLTSDAFNDLLERGMLPVEKFLPAFARQLRQEFGQSAEDAANTARAAFARLENSLLDLKLEFARSGFMDAIVDAARQLTDAFKDAQFRQSVREFGQLIGNLARFVVEHGDKLVVLGGVIAGARTGAAAGRLFGPKGALFGAGMGAIAGGAGAASILPEGTASGRDERRVMDVEAAVARLQRRIEETRRAAAAGLIKADEAARRIAEDQSAIARMTAKPVTPSPGGENATLGPALQWQALVDKYRSANDKLEQEIARAREIGKALGKPAAEIEAMVAKIRATAKSSDAAPRLPRLVESSEADLIRAQSILDREKALLEASWNAKKITAEKYYAQLDALAERQLALDAGRMQRELDALRSHLESLKRARGKSDGVDEQIAATEKRIDELMARIEARQRQIATEIEIRQADSLRIRFEMAEQAVAQIMARVRAEEQSINIARENYLISEAQAREKIVALHKAASEEMRGQAGLMAELANDLGEQYKIRAMEAANEWSRMSSDAASMNSMIREQIELLHAIRAINEATVDARHEAGIATDMEYLREKEASNRRTIELLREEQMLLRAIGQEGAALQIEAQIIRLSSQLDLVADKFRKIFEDHFATFFENVLSGTKKFKDVFLDLLRGILDDMKKLFARELSQQLMKFLSGKFGDSPSLEGRGFFSFLADLFFPSTGKGFKLFASGGYVAGPGTSTSDSIPARLSAGEYVIRAEAVRRFGVAFLDAINGLRLPPAWSANRLAFAAGGLVPAVAPPAPQQSIRIVNAVDPELARDYLESPAGERVLVNVISRNAGAIRNILGA